MRIKLAGKLHWLWRAIDEHGEVLDSLLQPRRNSQAAKRFFKRLLDNDLPEYGVTDGLRSYAAIRALPELTIAEPITVSAKEHQNNIEQSHRPTRTQARQQGYRKGERSQRFLFTPAHISNLFRNTRARSPAFVRRTNLQQAFTSWGELSLH